MSDRLARTVSHLTRVANADELERICDALSTGQLTPSTSRRVVEVIAGRRLGVVDATCRVQEAWQGAPFAADALILAIRATGSLKTRLGQDATIPELVWTGPRPQGSLVRATSEVMKEMISGARHSIILLGYSITGHGNLPSSAATILELLAEARRRLTDVTVVMHDTLENRRALIDSWPPGIALPRILIWVGDPAKPFAALHAKVLIADHDDLLITSANLTHHGMDANLEMGVRLRGIFVEAVIRHLTLLEREGLVVDYVD